MRFEVTVDGETVAGDATPRTMLAEWLRDRGKTGVHIGCDTSVCGACTVLLDGAPVKACTMLAVQAEGATVETIHGLTPNEGLSTIQEAFIVEHGLQCGFCTPGFIVAVTSLLAENPSPSRSEIEEGLEGNICRCTGYTGIIRAVERAAAVLRGERPDPVAGTAHEHPVD